MAGLKGNIAWLLAQAQSAKGTPATISATKAQKMPLSGGNIGPTRTTERLSETDASRDAGLSYVQQTGVEGSPEFYVRDKPAPFWLWAGLAFHRHRWHDQLHAHDHAGQQPPVPDHVAQRRRHALRALRGLQGRLAVGLGRRGFAAHHARRASRACRPRVCSSPRMTEPSFRSRRHRLQLQPRGRHSRRRATALVSSFEMTIENNVSTQQTDDSIPYDVVEGLREVSLGFDLIFESLDEYNKFHYGGAAGTAIRPRTSSPRRPCSPSRSGINNEIAFNLPSIAYEEFPIEPDPGGDPIVASVRAVGQRSGSPIVTATVKNQTAGTAYAA